MKIFWSWQSDTPGKIGRHFVRDVLNEAIEILKQPQDVEEPVEREIKNALHLDHDRKGVRGSPDLAPTIFDKIEQSAVFVADVTLVGLRGEAQASDRGKLINSNVAIEYGFALSALTDQNILLVQNTHYGERNELPFDLKHKAGPIQYCLGPDAAKIEIEAARKSLRGALVESLKPFVELGPARAEAAHQEIAAVGNIARFWNESEVVARYDSDSFGLRNDESIEYRFEEPHIFYARLIPTRPLANSLSVALLSEVVQARRLRVLTRTLNAAMGARNRFGAVAYEPYGSSVTPVAFSQIFRNGEIWGVTRELVSRYQERWIVPMVNVKNIYEQTLENWIALAEGQLQSVAPFQVELGAWGIQNVHLSLPKHLQQWHNDLSDPIFENELRVRRILGNNRPESRAAIVDEFIKLLYDLAGLAL